MNSTSHRTKLIKAAEAYLSQELSVIPVGADKKPLVPWKDYQTRQATRAELKGWFKDHNVMGIGIVTGKVSNLVVLDCEKGSDLSKLEIPVTPTVLTGGGGMHFYFKLPDGSSLQNRTKFRPLMDLRAEGGYVVAPPSLHPSGNRYRWKRKYLNASSMAPIPRWILQPPQTNSTPRITTPTIGGVAEGQRNVSAAVIVGKLFSRFPRYEWEAFAWPMLINWNSQNHPPLLEAELRGVFDSIELRQNARATDRPISEPTHVASWLSKPLVPERWLVDKLVPEDGITLISGYAGHYKTWIALHIARCVASEQSVFGRFVAIKKKILIVDEENHENDLCRRIRKLSYDATHSIYIWSQSGFKAGNKSMTDYILSFMERNEIGVVIFDSFRRINEADENESKQSAAFFDHLRVFVKHGASVILLHHHNKSTLGDGTSRIVRGSSDIIASVDCHLMVVKDEAGSGVAIITQTKSRIAKELDPFRIKVTDDETLVQLTFEGFKESKQTQEAAAYFEIPKLLGGKQLQQQEIVDSFVGRIGANSVLKALQRLTAENVVGIKTGQRYNKKIYFLAVDGGDSRKDEQDEDWEDDEDDVL